MAKTRRLQSYATRKLTRKLTRSIPYIGAVIAIALIGYFAGRRVPPAAALETGHRIDLNVFNGNEAQWRAWAGGEALVASE